MTDLIARLRRVKRTFESKAGKFASPIQFGLVGLSGMVPDLVSFSIFLLWLPLPIARGLAIWVAMSWNFYLNRRLTFSYARRGSALRQYVLFCGSCMVGALISWSTCLGLCLASDFFSQKKMIAAAIGVFAGAALNYLLSRHVVFLAPKRKSNPLITPLKDQGRGDASPAILAPAMETSVARS
jgi:dolichol-phosphate mannosyltransferase